MRAIVVPRSSLLLLAFVVGACTSTRTSPTPNRTERTYLADFATMTDAVTEVMETMHMDVVRADRLNDDTFVIWGEFRNSYARSPGTGGNAEAYQFEVHVERVTPIETRVRVRPPRSADYGSSQNRQNTQEFFTTLEARGYLPAG